MRIEVVDATGLPVPRGGTGRVRVRSPLAAHPGTVVTADLGYLDARGRLHLRGRDDGTVSCGGEIVHLTRVAAVLRTLLGVAAATVFPVDDPRFGHRVEAEVTLVDGAPHLGPEQVEAMRTAVRDRRGPHTVPRRVRLG